MNANQRRSQAASVIQANKQKAHAANHAKAWKEHGKPGHEHDKPKPETQNGPKPSGTK